MHQLERRFAEMFQTGGQTGRPSAMSAESRATTNMASALGTSTAHLGGGIVGSMASPQADARASRTNVGPPFLANASETSATVSPTNPPPIESGEARPGGETNGASSVATSTSGAT